MRQLRANVYAVGAIDWDRRLFDELVGLPDGTTYNAYLIKGTEKTALLDTVDPTKSSVLIDNLIKIGTEKIDYIIAHHAEQDHSGAIPDVLMLYPDAKIVTNKKCMTMLIDLLQIDEDRFITIDDGGTLSLGDRTLQFLYTPWVHWPETMSTYLQQDRIFFSCDFFGSHLAGSDLLVKDKPQVYEAAKRYYAEIMMPFRAPIKKNLEKIKLLQIDMIAPSHGPVYDEPSFIIDAYEDWVSDRVKNEVVLPYVSMHHSTEKMVEYFIDALIERDITVKPFNLTVTDIGRLAMGLVDAATIVFGSPMVLAGLHPKVAYAAILSNALRPKTKFVSVIGSCGWADRLAELTKSITANIKAEFLDPVVAKGYPKDEDFTAMDKLAGTIEAAHRKLGIAG